MIERFGKEELQAITKTFKNASYLSGFSNKYLGGEEIQKFEKEFAKKCQTIRNHGEYYKDEIYVVDNFKIMNNKVLVHIKID